MGLHFTESEREFARKTLGIGYDGVGGKLQAIVHGEVRGRNVELSTLVPPVARDGCHVTR